MDRTATYRVYNRCKFPIGLYVDSQNSKNIEPVTSANPEGGFQLLTGDQILFAENRARRNKFFAKRMLVIVDNEGREVPISEFNVVPSKKDTPYLDDEAILNALKMSNKKLEEWLDTVKEPAELHAIYLVAKDLDSLPKSKLSILQAKIPNKDWFSE